MPRHYKAKGKKVIICVWGGGVGVFSESKIFTFVLVHFFFFFWIEKTHSEFPGLQPLGSYVKHKQGLCPAAFEKDVNV